MGAQRDVERRAAMSVDEAATLAARPLQLKLAGVLCSPLMEIVHSPRQELDQYLFKAGGIHDMHGMAGVSNGHAFSRGQALMRGINDARPDGAPRYRPAHRQPSRSPSPTFPIVPATFHRDMIRG
jgi:hypothetical protein